MSILTFEVCSALVIALAIASMARRAPLTRVLSEVGALALSGFLAEEICLRAYQRSAYAPGWHLRVLDVPLVALLLWPLVVMSAREVARCISPESFGARRSLLVGLLVIADASLIEVIAVRAGLWTFREGGHLGVPLIGMVGWGFFAGAADATLARFPRWGALWVLVTAPLATHALLLASWWGFFRWVGRGDLGDASLAIVTLSGATATFGALRWRRRGIRIVRDVTLPRIGAALLSFALLISTAPRDQSLWMHVVAVGMPYLILTRL